jgi:hypothetical protein
LSPAHHFNISPPASKLSRYLSGQGHGNFYTGASKWHPRESYQTFGYIASHVGSDELAISRTNRQLVETLEIAQFERTSFRCESKAPQNFRCSRRSHWPASIKGQGDTKDVEPLKVTLRGLESMHTPSKTSILYSSPTGDDRLYPFCQKLKDLFTEAGFILEENRPLKLHATIVNTVYVPGARGKGGHRKSKAKLTLDAREILEDYEDFEWMSNVELTKLAICKMGAQKNGAGEEEYVVEGEVEMP